MAVRVLIIDDDRLIRSAVRRVLAHRAEMTVVESGVAALKLLEAGGEYDCILCDLIMPDMTGFELYAALMMTLPDMASRIIFLSGAGEASREFLRRVPNRFVEKPFQVDDLRAAVEGWAR